MHENPKSDLNIAHATTLVEQSRRQAEELRPHAAQSRKFVEEERALLDKTKPKPKPNEPYAGKA